MEYNEEKDLENVDEDVEIDPRHPPMQLSKDDTNTHKNVGDKPNKNAFELLMKSAGTSGAPKKRTKSGHYKTRGAICLLCFDQYKKDKKKKFWFSRFNNSSKKDHMKVHICTQDFISDDDPRASEAMKAFNQIESRREAEASNVKRQRLDIVGVEESSIERDMENNDMVIEAQSEQNADKPVQLELTDRSAAETQNEEHANKPEPANTISVSESQSDDTVEESLECTPTQSTPRPINVSQTSLKQFFSSSPGDQDKTVLDYIADRIGDRLQNKVKSVASTDTERITDVKERKSSVSNLSEFLTEEPDIEIIGENDTWILRCKVCHFYLTNPVASSGLKHKPTGDSLSTGLTLSEEEYSKYCQGNCPEWRRLKHRMLSHLSGSSKTHQSSAEYAKAQAATQDRRRVAVRNQLRTSIGVVQSKCAASHYELRIAELFQAGADVGDFGHSRVLFPQMIDVACQYIDQETKKYLQTCLQNTGLPPHYYVTADKSTNHRVSNQVTMICPVIDGKKTAIPLGMSAVYTDSSGGGGKGEELAAGIFNDLKKHANVEGEKLLQMQGKVTDGQYINNPFVTSMNQPLFDALENLGCSEEDMEILLQDEWWECHWDPGHWLDKVFSKFKDDMFVGRLLRRVSLFHQVFRHGKMHAIAKETAKELELPFRVTNAYAPQRFMSSSYLSLKRLEISYEAYVETFKDHHNDEEMHYKLCGNDFVFDLCGILDLLWPIVVLMLKAQLQWCPGWKFPAFVEAAIEQIDLFIEEVTKPVPSKQASPRLHKHAADISDLRFKSVELDHGWLITGRDDNGNFNWEARDTQDCRKDLKVLAEGIKTELRGRFETSFPSLNHTLHKCLDFGIQFGELCGRRTAERCLNVPIQKGEFAKFGAKEFKTCVAFVCRLPHVKTLNLPLCEEMSSATYWRMKETLISLVWGDLFYKFFPKFFKVVHNKRMSELQLKEGSFIISFYKASDATNDDFTVAETFCVEFDSGITETVVLQEEEVIKAIYTDSELYTSLGQEFCIVFDIMYAKTGTEAVVESFYGVVRSQEMDGGQSMKVLGDRTKIDWCFPPIIDCERALDDMAKLYINGDASLGINRHHVPVYKNRKSLRNSKELSKVLSRIQYSKKGLSFLR